MSFFHKKDKDKKNVESKQNLSENKSKDEEKTKIDLGLEKSEFSKAVEETNKEKENRQKNDEKKHNVLDYKFWIRIFASVILFVFGIALLIEKSFRERICIGIFGGIIIVYAIYRIFPLIKKKKTSVSRIINVIEILVDLVIGFLLVCGGFDFSSNQLTNFTIKYFKYFLGAVFVLRGLIYTSSNIFFKEESNIEEYLVNIFALCFGVFIMSNNTFSATHLGWVLVVICFLSAIFLLIEGAIDYKKYSNNKEEKREKKEKVKENKKTKEKKNSEKIKDKIEEKESSDDFVIPTPEKEEVNHVN